MMLISIKVVILHTKVKSKFKSFFEGVVIKTIGAVNENVVTVISNTSFRYSRSRASKPPSASSYSDAQPTDGK